MSLPTLFCFPFAGGSSWNFRQLAGQLRGRMDVVPIDLPGRGRRRAEPCVDTWPELEAALSAELRPQLREPCAFLGYSFGALVALNVMHRLAADDAPSASLPNALVACALRGPSAIAHPQLLHRMDDLAMFEALHGLGGIPDELLASPELVTLSAPSMRADLRLFETHERARVPLRVPIYAYYGNQDASVGEAFAAWREETSASFRAREFDGGHMFIHQHVAALADALVADLVGSGERRHIV